ncbi:MAG: hypothetical protein EA357_08885 [Micavibrio sp.]|nr:MAG: hypothetical protein EA357_08885 [Micavibrio sp.]
MSVDLKELEDKLLEMFNARHKYGKSSHHDNSFAQHAMAAAECADTLLRVRQQRHLEEGNAHLVPTTGHAPRALRRVTPKKQS